MPSSGKAKVQAICKISKTKYCTCPKKSCLSSPSNEAPRDSDEEESQYGPKIVGIGLSEAGDRIGEKVQMDQDPREGGRLFRDMLDDMAPNEPNVVAHGLSQLIDIEPAAKARSHDKQRASQGIGGTLNNAVPTANNHRTFSSGSSSIGEIMQGKQVTQYNNDLNAIQEDPTTDEENEDEQFKRGRRHAKDN